MGPGPIPWTVIVEYAKMMELEPEQVDALHYHIARMDSAYLEWCDRKVKRDSKQ